MSLPKLKTAVLVVDLIKAIERKRDVEVAKHRVDVAEYKTKRAEYVKQVKGLLRTKLQQLTPTFDLPKPRERWRARDVSNWLTEDLPESPAHPGDEQCIRSKYDQLIAQLKISADPKIRLSPEDFAKFMVGDASACPC